MYYEFYIDVFFVVNLLVDFLVLCLTVRILGGRLRPLRAFGAALMGAGGMCLFVLLSGEINRGRSFIFYSVMVVGMLHLCCGFQTIRKLLSGVYAFHGAALLLGGFLSSLPQMQRKKLLLFSAIAITAYSMIDISIRLYRYLKGKRTVQCEVVVALGRKEMKVKGLYDTGNCLYDYDTGKPVCIMDYSSFCGLLEKEEQEALERFCSMTDRGKSKGQEDVLERLKPHFLLYTSVGCQRGLLPVVTADRLTVLAGEEKRQKEKVVIGLSKTALSPYGNFQMIISPTILDS